MKRIILVGMLCMVLVIFIGCSNDALEIYKSAVEKTGSIQRGRMSYDMTVQNYFIQEGLSSEKIKKLNYFNNIEAKNIVIYDNEKNYSILENYFNFGGMGFDSTAYIKENKVMVQMPIVGKYMTFSLSPKDEDVQIDTSFEENIFKPIEEKWKAILQEKNVVSGNKTIMETEDGKVKVTHFQINLTNQQIQKFFKESIEIVQENDEMLKQFLSNLDIISEENVSMLLDVLTQKTKNITLEEFTYDAYIDIDEYIIQENIHLIIDYNDARSGQLKTQSVDVEIKNWNIEKTQVFQFPELADENTLEKKNIDQGIPFIFEGVFGAEKKEGE